VPHMWWSQGSRRTSGIRDYAQGHDPRIGSILARVVPYLDHGPPRSSLGEEPVALPAPFAFPQSRIQVHRAHFCWFRSVWSLRVWTLHSERPARPAFRSRASWKKERPFAAGDISIPEGCSHRCSCSRGDRNRFLLDTQFGLVLLGYSALTMVYSLYLKKIALLDVFVLPASTVSAFSPGL